MEGEGVFMPSESLGGTNPRYDDSAEIAHVHGPISDGRAAAAVTFSECFYQLLDLSARYPKSLAVSENHSGWFAAQI